MIKLYSYSHDWFAWRPVRLGFTGRGPLKMGGDHESN